MPATNPDDLRTALRAVLDEHRADAASLSRQIGRSKDYIRDFLEGRKTTLPLTALVKIENALSLAPGFLLRAEFTEIPFDTLLNIAKKVSESDTSELEWPRQEIRADRLPVFSYRDALDGTLFVNRRVQYTVPKPHIVESSPDAYGVIVEGGVMSPAFDPGDIIIVNPNVSFRVDADAILFGQFASDDLPENESQRAAIRRLTGYDEESWQVLELCPFKKAALPRGQWPRLSRIVGKFART